MSQGTFNYCSNSFEEALIQELIQELGFNKKTDFFDTILYDKRINISLVEMKNVEGKDVKIKSQSIAFEANKKHLQNFDEFFISNYNKAEKNEIDLSKYTKLDEFMDLIKDTKTTHIQFMDICLEALERILSNFDFDVATPELNKLSVEDPFMKNINKRVLKSSVKPVSKPKSKRTSKQIPKINRTQKTILIENIEDVKSQIENHPLNNLNEEKEKIIQSCIETIKLIKSIKKDNDKTTTFDPTVAKIQKVITSVSNPKPRYNNFDFLKEKLLSLNIYSYSNTEKQLKTITPFLQNLSELNYNIKVCRIIFNDKTSMKNDKIKAVYELRKQLCKIIENQYYLLVVAYR